MGLFIFIYYFYLTCMVYVNGINNKAQHNQKKITKNYMAVASTTTVEEWREKLRSASQGDYQVLQSIKDYIFQNLDPLHPIFKQSFYDILQQGYLVHELDQGQPYRNTFETYKQIGMYFLLRGTLQIKCINLEADTEVIKSITNKGIIEVTQPQLAAKYGSDNVNLITKFEMQAKQKALLIEIMGKNKMAQNQNARNQPISQKQHNVMRKFLIFPSKEVQRVQINSQNKGDISKKFYLLSGKICMYWECDNAKKTNSLDSCVILAAYHEGYFNPAQFSCEKNKQVTKVNENTADKGSQKKQKKISDKFPSKTPSKVNRTSIVDKKNPQTPKSQGGSIKMYIFQGSEIMYFQEDFMKDDYVKALELKRKKHLDEIVSKYNTLSKQDTSNIQDKLIIKYKLPRKQVNSNIYKIPEIKRQTTKKGLSATVMNTNERLSSDKAIKSRNDLRSTSSSVKCSLRIRKVKKN